MSAHKTPMRRLAPLRTLAAAVAGWLPALIVWLVIWLVAVAVYSANVIEISLWH